MLVRRGELGTSATQKMVAGEFYHGKPWVNLSEEELLLGLNPLLALMRSRLEMRIFTARYSARGRWMRVCC